MEIELLAFGITREILGTRKQTLHLDGPMSLAELKLLLEDKYPKLSTLKSLSLAYNEEYVPNETVINDNATVALIPPVSGG